MPVTIENKPNISEKLKEKLVNMEARQSPFEKAVRELDVDIAKAFISGKAVKPVFFENTGRKLKATDAKLDAFSKIIAENDNNVLEGKKTLVDVKGKRVAVLFSGGPAAGGHNVLAGLKKVLGVDNTLFGIGAGPKGLLQGRLFELKDEDVARVFNLGGFDLLGSDRTKITTTEQFEMVKKTVKDYNLDGIVIIGGDDSNTNAAFLAEYLYDEGCKVIGVPKTIDGDLQVGDLVPISFGFDTATKVYAELVGNILQDTPSSRKYWHFVKLMGRSASHVALEVALRTRASITIISEEIAEKKMTLNELVEGLAKVIAIRAAKGIKHGVIVVPEGVIEFIPEFKQLISELNEAIGESEADMSNLSLNQKLALIKLSIESATLLGSLPPEIENKLFMDRDSHGNLQVSQIPTELLLIQMTEKKIDEMKSNPDKFFGKGKIDLDNEELSKFYRFSFKTNSHFFGYEGRCGAPSRFDASYTYNLGLVAGSLILQGKTGYMAGLTGLDSGARPVAVPLTGLIVIERRHGKDEMVIKKALVDQNSPAFKYFQERRREWEKKDVFSSPGPRQMWGPTSRELPFTVALNQGYENMEYSIGDS